MYEGAIHFNGYRLVEAPFMCDKVQARKHKKKRINKKWRKRYGMKEIPWTKIFVLGNNAIYAHPKMIERLIEEMKLKGMTG